MTEIAWIVKLMTSYKLPDDAKEACISRIGEVEEKLSHSYEPVSYNIRSTPTLQGASLNSNGNIVANTTGQPPAASTLQAASTLMALARQAQGETAPTGRLPVAMPGEVVKGLEGLAVPTGNGLRGKRKW